MSKITTEDIESVLSSDEAKSIDEIAKELHPGESKCEECNRPTETYKKTREGVREVLLVMMDRSKITSTPDWNYRLARR